MSSGIFITFEGPEGAGKSTQIKRLTARLIDQGHEVLVTREPGGTPLAEEMRRIVKQTSSEVLSPVTELLLMEAARAQHVANLIAPALQQGKIVLCDRFSDSTLAYQGYARGGDLAEIERLNEMASAGAKISRTLLLDLPVEIGFERAGKRQETLDDFDRFEREERAFHHRVREGFLALAKRSPERIKVIDATGTPDEIACRIAEALHDII